MGYCLIRQRRFKKETFGDVRVSTISTGVRSSYSYTSTDHATYIISGNWDTSASTGPNMNSLSVSNGGTVLYSNAGTWSVCGIVDLPAGASFSISTGQCAMIVAKLPVKKVQLERIAYNRGANAGSSASFSNGKLGGLYLGISNYGWHSCVSGTGRGVDISRTNCGGNSVTYSDGWNGNVIGTLIPTSTSNSGNAYCYMNPEWGNNSASWMFRIYKKSW